MSNQDEFRFVVRLLRLAGLNEQGTLVRERDAARLAQLRRGLGKPAGSSAETLPVLYPLLPQTIHPADEWRWFLVATLFAFHVRHDPDAGNLGDSFAKLDLDNEARNSTDKDKPNKTLSPVERRFVSLLRADADSLHVPLRQAVSLLKSKEISVNWLRLLSDLRWWNDPKCGVQRQWARSFWRQFYQESSSELETHSEEVNHD